MLAERGTEIDGAGGLPYSAFECGNVTIMREAYTIGLWALAYGFRPKAYGKVALSVGVSTVDSDERNNGYGYQ